MILRFTVAGLLLLGTLRILVSGGGVERKDLLAMMGVGAGRFPRLQASEEPKEDEEKRKVVEKLKKRES